MNMTGHALPPEGDPGLSSELELIRRAQAGEQEAFCLLAQAHERRVYALAFHYCRDHQDAEDLSQEVWLKAFAALATFRHESSFYTWLRKIMINCFLNHRRVKSFRWRTQFTDSTTADDQFVAVADRFAAASMEVTLQNRLVVEKAISALADVTPQQRLVFLLKHQEGMTYEEIAKELGCSTGSVKKSVSRTITKLRERLGVNDESENYVSCAAGGY